MASWAFKPSTTAETRVKISQLFGKLVYVFASSRVRADFEGAVWEAEYRVLESADDVLVIELLHKDGPEQLTVTFVGEHIRLGQSPHYEYFRRATD